MATAMAGIATVGTAAAYVTSKSAQSASERPDCPGKIICPITGELVCIDQCPLEQDAVVSLPIADDAALPACCAGKD